MLEMLNAIPENVGWVIVGAMGAFTLMAYIALAKVVYYAIKCRVCKDDNE